MTLVVCPFNGKFPFGQTAYTRYMDRRCPMNSETYSLTYYYIYHDKSSPLFVFFCFVFRESNIITNIS